MELREFFSEDAIKLELEGETKDDELKELIGLLSLDEKAAAAVLDVTPGTLSVWRSTGRYALPFLKVGRNVRYRHSDLLAWLEKRQATLAPCESK